MKKYRFIQSGLAMGLLLLSGFASSVVHAAAKSNNDFRDYMFQRCNDPGFVTPRNPSDPQQLQQANRNFSLCSELFPGTVGAFVSDVNIVVFSDMGGATGAGGTA